MAAFQERVEAGKAADEEVCLVAAGARSSKGSHPEEGLPVWSGGK